MAHQQEKRRELRSYYVLQRLPMDAAAKKAKVPKTTANRWKAEARKAGDDWDHHRAAVAMGDDSFNLTARKLLEDYLAQHQATMDLLRTDTTLKPVDRADVLASCADSFHKTMAAFKRLSPELNRQAVALDVLAKLAKFAQAKHPKHVPMLLELLEPFGEQLAQEYA